MKMKGVLHTFISFISKEKTKYVFSILAYSKNEYREVGLHKKTLKLERDWSPMIIHQ